MYLARHELEGVIIVLLNIIITGIIIIIIIIITIIRMQDSLMSLQTHATMQCMLCHHLHETHTHFCFMDWYRVWTKLCMHAQQVMHVLSSVADIPCHILLTAQVHQQ